MLPKETENEKRTIIAVNVIVLILDLFSLFLSNSLLTGSRAHAREPVIQIKFRGYFTCCPSTNFLLTLTGQAFEILTGDDWLARTLLNVPTSTASNRAAFLGIFLQWIESP